MWINSEIVTSEIYLTLSKSDKTACCILIRMPPLSGKRVLYWLNQMMFKKSFKGIRSTAVFNNSSIYDFININSCNF